MSHAVSWNSDLPTNDYCLVWSVSQSQCYLYCVYKKKIKGKTYVDILEIFHSIHYVYDHIWLMMDQSNDIQLDNEIVMLVDHDDYDNDEDDGNGNDRLMMMMMVALMMKNEWKNHH